MSRQKSIEKFVSTNLNDEAIAKLIEPLTERTEQSVSGGTHLSSGGQVIIWAETSVFQDRVRLTF